MTIYVVIDTETFTNIAVGTSWKQVMAKVLEQDVYFKNPSDFFINYEKRYEVQKWEVN